MTFCVKWVMTKCTLRCLVTRMLGYFGKVARSSEHAFVDGGLSLSYRNTLLARTLRLAAVECGFLVGLLARSLVGVVVVSVVAVVGMVPQLRKELVVVVRQELLVSGTLEEAALREVLAVIE